MEQPEGFEDPINPEYVCKLNKGLYGLKQSARCWNSTLDKYLEDSDYRSCSADGCLYIKTQKSSVGKIDFVILAVFVDDFIPVSNNLHMLSEEKAAFCDRFEMLDKGKIHDVLGLLVTRDRKNKTIFLSQPDYAKSILIRFRMENCKPVSTPLESGKQFRKLEGDEKPFDRQLYQQAIGCLTYFAMSTRPDVSITVGLLSQFMASPSIGLGSNWTTTVITSTT